MPEREIVVPVELCLPNGRLNQDAVGFYRSPLLNTDRIGKGLYGWGRNKRWEYWGVTTPTHILAITVSSLDYAGLHQVWAFDRATGEAVDATEITMPWAGPTLPGTLGAGQTHVKVGGLEITIDEVDGGTRLRGSTPRVSFDVMAHRPEGHEFMGVVVPWSKRLFQYTVKDVARPATGFITVDGVTTTVQQGESWAVLDHGRGRWPYTLTWNWGAASGVVDGRTIGVQLGGKWTAGTGSTENALVVDGRMHKISEELVWDYDQEDWLRPWRITGERADLTFTPFYDRISSTNFVVIASATHQCFGYYSGWMADDAGERVQVDGVLGWAEHVTNRW